MVLVDDMINSLFNIVIDLYWLVAGNEKKKVKYSQTLFSHQSNICLMYSVFLTKHITEAFLGATKQLGGLSN